MLKKQYQIPEEHVRLNIAVSLYKFTANLDQSEATIAGGHAGLVYLASNAEHSPGFWFSRVRRV